MLSSVNGLLLVVSLALTAPKDGGAAPVPGGEGRPVAVPERAALVPTAAAVGADGGRAVVTVTVDDTREGDGDTPTDDRAAARQAFRAAGERLTGKALAARFGRSERWGRDRIRECTTG